MVIPEDFPSIIGDILVFHREIILSDIRCPADKLEHNPVERLLSSHILGVALLYDGRSLRLKRQGLSNFGWGWS
eukprot:1345940-Amorphochlora_amoeboformis.AAC.1